MKKVLSLLATAALLSACSDTPSVSSPDGSIKVDVSRDGSSLSYAVTVGGDTLIALSRLGFDADGLTPAADSKMTVKHSSFDQTWTQPWGENKEIRNYYNEVAVTLTDAALEYTVRVRAFDDGVAFRYEWNLVSGDSVIVRDELTEFAFARPAMSWAIPANFDTYELEYRNVAIDDVTDANTPFTFEVDSAGIFGSIHEAALYDYPEMTLVRTAGRTLKTNLAPLPDGVKAYLPSGFATPWRSIQLGKSACDLINSGLILNLNEPSKIADTSWIKPQKYVGIWWGMHLGTMTWTMGPRHGATTENAIRYIDFAAENNLQGEIGKYIAVVRRAGDNYYLGAGTDSNARTLTVPLTFLGDGTYTATVYADDPADATKVVISSRDVTAADTLTVEMAAAGGQAVTFMPKR